MEIQHSRRKTGRSVVPKSRQLSQQRSENLEELADIRSYYSFSEGCRPLPTRLTTCTGSSYEHHSLICHTETVSGLRDKAGKTSCLIPNNYIFRGMIRCWRLSRGCLMKRFP